MLFHLYFRKKPKNQKTCILKKPKTKKPHDANYVNNTRIILYLL